jgi:hypothetical protein
LALPAASVNATESRAAGFSAADGSLTVSVSGTPAFVRAVNAARWNVLVLRRLLPFLALETEVIVAVSLSFAAWSQRAVSRGVRFGAIVSRWPFLVFCTHERADTRAPCETSVHRGTAART